MTRRSSTRLGSKARLVDVSNSPTLGTLRVVGSTAVGCVGAKGRFRDAIATRNE